MAATGEESAKAGLAQTATLGGLREAHLQLLRRWRDLAGKSSDEAAQAAEDLRKYAASSGVNISNRDVDGRDEAQGIIDYWTAALSGLKGARFPEFLQLADYVGAQAQSWALQAQEVFDGYSSEEEKRVARELLQMLIVSRGGTYARAPAISRASLQQHIASAQLDAVIADFVGAGAISLIPAAQAKEEDRFEIGDLALVDRWPALKTWIEERDKQVADRDSILKRAEHWARAGRPDYLLASSSKDIESIDRYRGKTDTLDAYIDASKARHSREQRWRYAGAGVLIAAAAAGIAAFVFLEWHNLSEQKLRTRQAREELMVATNAAQAAAKMQAEHDYAQTVKTNAQQVPDIDQTPAIDATSDLIRPSKAPALDGYMWFGQDSDRQVRPDDPKAVLKSFADVSATMRLRANTDIYLRVQWPKSAEEYTSPKPKGIVPKDALVILRENLRAYDRVSGVQYWAHVVYVPQVSMIYAGLDQERAERIEKSLEGQGFEVAATRDREAARGHMEVRYFLSGPRDGLYNTGPADALMLAGRMALSDRTLMAERLHCVATKRPADPDRPKLLELVVDPRADTDKTAAASCAKAAAQ